MTSARRTAAVLVGATAPVLAPALAGCGEERAQAAAAAATAPALTPMAQDRHTTGAEVRKVAGRRPPSPLRAANGNGPGPGRRRSGVKAAPPAVRPLRTLSRAPESVLGPESCEFGE
ncbi:hypothetical protein OG930_26135 [Streptomyces sp. NBC_01799]|uniref:hypothetical protein n=1 Tax=Streptomyces sp. NBC_01800 TaxID=2975945 RepID=UPI002DDB3CD8|nr:hypothetical protein [Streptomyces sp. NBC_01800]WSA70304.1 hypothetical protein OIE65_26915 [Streptomyces sp. NBC_01800]WSA78782.1 hypothetical protein OG930_26135 [Streptomyces sp. NBC_01799]